MIQIQLQRTSLPDRDIVIYIYEGFLWTATVSILSFLIYSGRFASAIDNFSPSHISDLHHQTIYLRRAHDFSTGGLFFNQPEMLDFPLMKMLNSHILSL